MPGSTEHRINIVLVVFDTLRKDCVGCYGSSPPWDGASPVQTPNLDRFAEECIRFTSAYPESLPTLPARRSIYTGMRTYPFHDGRFRLRGDFVPAPGWGPIPEDQDTLAEMLGNAGYRTALISDLYHQFKPSKNYWRGFDQWSFIRGQETDPAVSGPLPTKDDIDRWVPKPIQELRFTSDESYRAEGDRPSSERFFERAWLNRPRGGEERWPNAQVMVEAARWLEENADARERGQPFFLTVECFDPHEPWFVPDHYLRLYDHGPEQA
ncbi:MAG: sulfatase-like hydrolase/transferase, partial [Actinomycetota bacterium]